MKKALFFIFTLFLVLGLAVLIKVYSKTSHEKLTYPIKHEIMERWQLGRLQYKATGEVIYILVSENSKKEEILNLANYYRINKKYKHLVVFIFNNKNALNEFFKNIDSDSLYLKNRFIRKHLVCTIGYNIVNKGRGSFEPHNGDEIIWRGIIESTDATIYERQLTEEEIKIQAEKSKEIDYVAKYKKMVSDGASMNMIIEEMKKEKLSYHDQVWFLTEVFELDSEIASKIISDSGTTKP